MSFKFYLEEVQKMQNKSNAEKPYYSLFFEHFENGVESMGVIIDVDVESKLLLTEGKWKFSGHKDWWYRTDQANAGTGTEYHVHIAKGKHKNSIPQYSWDKKARRHDAHKFGAQVPKYVKQLAGKILGIKPSLLEALEVDGREILLG